MKESGKLRQEKCYTLPGNLKSKCSIGLGNGHKKSKRYEEFVIVERTKLREDVRLCERATQKVLMYSNNFLHKRLKTEGRPCRIERTRGKAQQVVVTPCFLLLQQPCRIERTHSKAQQDVVTPCFLLLQQPCRIVRTGSKAQQVVVTPCFLLLQQPCRIERTLRTRPNKKL
ncbi:hypothetical protein DPMN_150423 [Dreissena polymorpha]|uniref:Uncharacterized protein n=1 Tax=Dreissena polymorpha TaxID=45954 RepID=A0A9D4J5Z3_DREPO|nr:hypothetical protein DPMN_150423 [Dreissena polymorpha]